MAGSKPSWLQTGVTEIALRAQERRARRLLLQGDLDGAIAAYDQIIGLDPDHAEAHYQLGLCYRQQRRWDDAAHAFSRAQELGDDRADPWLAELAASHAEEEEPAVVVGGRVLTQAGPDRAPSAAQDQDASRVSEPRGLYVPQEGFSAGYEDAEEVAKRPILCPPIDDVFAPDGPLASALGTVYRARPGQVRMANLVREALQGRRHAVIEAGTGIGKSFAYLIPVLWSGTPAVVSTSNKGLMNQLWKKDIPRLQKIAPRPVKAALLKGRSNYICLVRLARLRQQVGMPGQAASLALIEAGRTQVPTGDVEMMGLPPQLIAQITVGGRECRGRHCEQFDACLYERAKREALQADVVVTNHALLCHNVLLSENHILPVRPVLIIDEAHQLTRYAVEALTMALGQDDFWSLLNSHPVRETTRQSELLTELQLNYDEFLRAIGRQRPGHPGARRRPIRWALEGEIEAGLALWDALQRLGRELARDRGLDEGARESAVMHTVEVAATAKALAVPEPDTHIRLCEVQEQAAGTGDADINALYRPLEVTAPLEKLLFEVWPRVICTSATLGVGKDLGWFRRQVGLFDTDNAPRVIAQALKGPFDYGRQMLLYTPAAVAPVYDEAKQRFAGGYVSQLTEEVRRLLEASRGRALVLCTSRERMTQLYETLAPVLQGRYPCYLQGAYAQPELVARFKRDGNAILFATRGFWEGLDIPGDALALVILDKIPFLPYDDPVMRRQEARIRARGGNPFYELQLGAAILNLRQGTGRLIRSETDRGVIALLDARVLRKSYGRRIIEALPEAHHTTDFADVADFLSS